MADQGIGTVEILDDLHGGAVAPHAQSHQALKDIFPLFCRVASLHSAATGIIIEILQNLRDIVVGKYFVAVQDYKIIIILPSGKIVVQIAGFVPGPVGSANDLHIPVAGGKGIDFFHIGFLVAVIQDHSGEIFVLLLHAQGQSFFVEIVPGAVEKQNPWFRKGNIPEPFHFLIAAAQLFAIQGICQRKHEILHTAEPKGR